MKATGTPIYEQWDRRWRDPSNIEPQKPAWMGFVKSKLPPPRDPIPLRAKQPEQRAMF